MDKKIFLFFLIPLGLITSCEELMNEPEDSSNALLFQTEEAIENSLDKSYENFKTCVEFFYVFDAVFTNQIEVPNEEWTPVYEREIGPDNRLNHTLWNQTYDLIYQLNKIIKSADQFDRKVIIAQAKTMRAYLFHNLSNWYGAIPLDEEIQNSEKYPAPEEEVIYYIQKELKEAAELLPVNWSKKNYFTKDLAHALLVRLNTSDFLWDTSAVAYTKKILNTGFYSLADTNESFTAHHPEIIWGFEKRANTVFADYFNAGDYIPLIRLTECYLAMARNYYENGYEEEALKYLNILRKRRNQPLLSSLNEELIIEQWSLEIIIHEGMYFYTLKSFRVFQDNLNVVDYLEYIPIPNSALVNNPNLYQNSAY